MPGHTQLTRIPSRAYSTAATFASWITAAFVAQYGAACDHAVRPATDAVRTIDPDCCARMTGTAARMPLTAPSTLTRNARSQSSVVRLWMRPFGASTPALLISTSSRPKRSTAQRDDGFDVGDLATSAGNVSTPPRSSGKPFTVASSDGCADVAQHDVGVGFARELGRDSAAPSVPPAPVIATTRRLAMRGSLIRAGIRRRR